MSTETKNRIRFEQAPDGKMIFTEPDGKTHECLSPLIAQQIDEIEKTAAQKELEDLRARREPLVETHTIGGRERYLKKLDSAGVTLVGILRASHETQPIIGAGEEITPLRRLQNMRRYMAAVLYVGMASSADNPDSFYFDSYEQAIEFVAMPDYKDTLSLLFDKITELNADLLPRDAKKGG